MSRDDHARIVELVNRAAPGRARLVEFEKMDHGYYVHDSMRQSYRDYRSGTFNEEVASVLLEWLRTTFNSRSTP